MSPAECNMCYFMMFGEMTAFLLTWKADSFPLLLNKTSPKRCSLTCTPSSLFFEESASDYPFLQRRQQRRQTGNSVGNTTGNTTGNSISTVWHLHFSLEGYTFDSPVSWVALCVSFFMSSIIISWSSEYHSRKSRFCYPKQTNPHVISSKIWVYPT